MNAGGNSSNRADSKESPTYSWFIPLVGEAKSSSDTVPTRCNHKNIYHQKKEEGDDDKENNVILHKKDDLRSCILQRITDLLPKQTNRRMQRRVWIKWVECAHRMRQRYKDIKRLQRVLDCQRNFYRMSEYFRIWKALTSPKEVLLPFAHSSRDMKAKTKTLGSWTSTSEIQLDKDNVKLTVYMDRQVQTDYSFTEKVVTTSSPTANSSKEKKSESKEEGEIDDGDEYIIDSREAAVQILAFELRRRGLFIEQ